MGTRAPGRPAPRTWLHGLLLLIDDDLVDLAVLRARPATLDVLRPAFLADWLRMTTFQPGLGPVLWSEGPAETVDRLGREWERPDVGSVKMTPTGANAMRAMDDPPETLRRFYADQEGRADGGPAEAEAVAQEVEAVMSLVLVPAGLVSPDVLSRAGRGRTG